MTESLLPAERIISDQKDDDKTSANLFIKEIKSLVKDLSNVTLTKKSDIVSVILIAMKSISVFKHLKGSSKRLIVIESLKHIINTQKNMTELDKQLLIHLIDDIAPVLIDTIYNAASDKIDFNPSDSICCVPTKREK